MMRRLWRASTLTATLALGALACNADRLNIPQYNAPTIAGANADPVGVVRLLATGILLTDRNNYAGFIEDVGVFGRESYDYFPTDARTVSHYLIGQPGPGGTRLLDPTGFASGNWNQWYNNIKNESNLLAVVENANLTNEQKAGTRGFARTFRALDLYYLIVTRDSLGVPVSIPDDPTVPAPWQSRDQVWNNISALLDSAKADLQSAGGSDFPFSMHSGFDGFSTPASFLKFNRAIAARVLVNRGALGCAACYTQALTVVGESFIKPATTQADLDFGVYHIYSNTSGDRLNGLNFVTDPNELAHASTVADAQLQPSGAKDDRVARKIAQLSQPRPAPGSNNGIPANYFFTMYATTTTPAPIIRNEELILVRAEAELQTGATAAALADLNAVRTLSGKLAPLGSLGADPIGTLLYERRMSLLWEGHRWNDMRRFGRLAQLPLDLSTHFVARVMPIPKTECDARPKAAQPAIGC
jgi:hypothetical protein